MGIRTAERATLRSSLDPPNLVGSVNTEIAAAPPAWYATTCRGTSSVGLITPFEGDDRLTSAITLTSTPRRASANLGTGPTRSPVLFSSAVRGARVAARARASSVNAPSVPLGGVQAERACASVDLRLT